MADEQRVLTDEELAQQNIFGNPPAERAAEVEEPENPDEPEEPEEPEQPENPDEDSPENPEEPEQPEEPEDPDEPEQPSFNIDEVKEDQVLELMNKKFNVNFETMDAATEYFASQSKLRGQDEIINKLVEELKNKSNVLSHFSSDNAYKVAQLAKSDYPGKEEVLSKVMSSDVEKLGDFDAIRLRESLKRPSNSRVDPLRFKMSKLGLRDLDMAEFDEWDEADKEIVYGEAEDAKIELAALQSKVELPKDGSEQASDLLSEIERGVQERNTITQKAIDEATPIMESLVTGLTKINPVEGSDFEYEVSLDNDSRRELTDFLVGTATEGGYDLRSDSAIRELNGLLQQEIWATDGPKIAAAYAKAEAEKAAAETEKKYENWSPLDEGQQRKSKKETGEQTDEDAAQSILRRG